MILKTSDRACYVKLIKTQKNVREYEIYLCKVTLRPIINNKKKIINFNVNCAVVIMGQ